MVQHISEEKKAEEAARNISGEEILEMETSPCSFCGQPGTVRVFPRELRLWESGLKVQDAFVGMSADEREMLISGTHPKCWDEAFGSED